MSKIYIDGDGCPVVYLTLEIADEYHMECCIVCDNAHEFAMDKVEVIIVDQGMDSADYKILNLLRKGDIVITQDYGLATMALAKGAYPLSQNGILYADENIDALLAQRHDHIKQRKTKHRYAHIPKRRKEDDEAFDIALCHLLDRLIK